jgi:hypothetical protein
MVKRSVPIIDDAPRGHTRQASAPPTYLPMLSPERIVHFYKMGWRPAFGWLGVLIFAGIGARLVSGASIPGVVEIIGVLSPVFLAMVNRTVEKLNGAAG